MSTSGSIEVILGPMFAGKSTELIRNIKRHKIGGKKVLVIKHHCDNRYSEKCVATHDQETFEAFACSEIAQVGDLYVEYDVIGIDEGQFFPDIVAECEKMAREGKKVIVAGLSGTFERKPLGDILSLIPLCEKLTKLTSVCTYCSADRDAIYTVRTITNKSEVLIGGQDIYRPACRPCFYAQSEQGRQAAEMQAKETVADL